MRIFHFHPVFLSYLSAGRGSSTTAGSSLTICSPAVPIFLVTASLVPDVAPSPVLLTQLSRSQSVLSWSRAALFRPFSGEERSAVAAQSS